MASRLVVLLLLVGCASARPDTLTIWTSGTYGEYRGSSIAGVIDLDQDQTQYQMGMSISIKLGPKPRTQRLELMPRVDGTPEIRFRLAEEDDNQ